MSTVFEFPALALPLRHDRHVVQARQRARDLAALLGFEHQDQIRLATAASELARNAFRYAQGGQVQFRVEEAGDEGRSSRFGGPAAGTQMFVISVADQGPGIPHLEQVLSGRYVSKTGLGKGMIGIKRLMDHFSIDSTALGTHVEFGKALPPTSPRVTAAVARTLVSRLAGDPAADPFAEVERQNRELLKTLSDLKEKQEQLAELNRELEDTNRGVVALYAELEQHADDLRRVSDLKTNFLSNLTHEFRTPLNSISSLSRLLLAHADGELTPEQAKQVGFIQHSAGELSELVNDLLDLAKVEAGRVDVKPRHFDVAEFFGALRGMLKPLLAGNGLDLLFESTSDIPTLYTDEGKVSQILRNLISNALKFTRKGHIRVTAECEPGGWIVFRVADTGIGIAPEDLNRIFEEFVQIEGDLQSQVKGTGLGLPLARRLSELLGGRLEVESEAGIGSTFTVRLPTEFGKAAQEPPKSIKPSTSQTGPMVLFIEDNHETSFVHQAALRNTRFRAVSAGNLAEARAALRVMMPALIVLDRQIERKDALPFIPELRSLGYEGPVLVISVFDEPAAALAAGASAFLAKPVPPFTLLNIVRELIEGKTSRVVLLVDDDEVSRYLVGGALVKAGFRILEAHGGREAMRLLQTEVPDAILLDLTMPDMTGFEVLREIRSSNALAVVPVILHSSKDITPAERGVIAETGALVYPKQSFAAEDGLENLLHLLRRVIRAEVAQLGIPEGAV